MASVASLPANLRRYRAARDLSQDALAEKAGLPWMGYGDVEDGKATPRLGSLRRMADALGVPVRDLLAPVRELSRVPFRTRGRTVSRESVLADVARWLEDYAEVEALLGKRREWRLAEVAKRLRGSRKKGAALGRHAAELAREALGLSSGGRDEVIRDMGWLLHRGAYDAQKSDADEAEKAEADAFASSFIRPERPRLPADRVAREPPRLVAPDFTADRLRGLVRDAVEQEKITRSRAGEVLRLSPSDMRGMDNDRICEVSDGGWGCKAARLPSWHPAARSPRTCAATERV